MKPSFSPSLPQHTLTSLSSFYMRRGASPESLDIFSVSLRRQSTSTNISFHFSHNKAIKAQDPESPALPTPQDTLLPELESLWVLGPIKASWTDEACNPSALQPDVVDNEYGPGLETTGVSLW